MSVHVQNVFMAVNPKTLNRIREIFKKNFNISESGKVKNFLGVYYDWVHDVKGKYAKITIEKDVDTLVEGYEKYTGSDVKVQKTPGAPVTTLCKSDLEEPYSIDK